jgi:hypothetical protein
LGEGFPGDASPVVDAARVERVVRVGDPRHLALAGAVVGSRNVDAGSDEVLGDQLGGVAARDALELFGGVVARAQLDAALAAAERHVADRALVGHQRGQRHDLVLVHHPAVANAPLQGLPVVAVLGAPGFEDHVLVVDLHRELHVVDVVADPDLLQEARRQIHVRGGFLELPRHDVVEVEIFRGLLRPGGQSASPRRKEAEFYQTSRS